MRSFKPSIFQDQNLHRYGILSILTQNNKGGSPIPVVPVTWGNLKNKGITWGNLKSRNITWDNLKNGVEL